MIDSMVHYVLCFKQNYDYVQLENSIILSQNFISFYQDLHNEWLDFPTSDLGQFHDIPRIKMSYYKIYLWELLDKDNNSATHISNIFVKISQCWFIVLSVHFQFEYAMKTLGCHYKYMMSIINQFQIINLISHLRFL